MVARALRWGVVWVVALALAGGCTCERESPLQPGSSECSPWSHLPLEAQLASRKEARERDGVLGCLVLTGDSGFLHRQAAKLTDDGVLLLWGKEKGAFVAGPLQVSTQGSKSLRFQFFGLKGPLEALKQAHLKDSDASDYPELVEDVEEELCGSLEEKSLDCLEPGGYCWFVLELRNLGKDYQPLPLVTTEQHPTIEKKVSKDKACALFFHPDATRPAEPAPPGEPGLEPDAFGDVKAEPPSDPKAKPESQGEAPPEPRPEPDVSDQPTSPVCLSCTKRSPLGDALFARKQSLDAKDTSGKNLALPQLAIYPKGGYLAGRLPEAQTGFFLWKEQSNGAFKPRFPHTSMSHNVTSFAWSPQGKYLGFSRWESGSSGQKNAYVIWKAEALFATPNPSSRTMLCNSQPKTIWVGFSADESFFFALREDGNLHLYPLTPGMKCPNSTSVDGGFGKQTVVALHPSKNELAIGGRVAKPPQGTAGPGQVVFYKFSPSSFQKLPSRGFEGYTQYIPTALAYHPQKSQLLVGAQDGYIELWSATTRAPTTPVSALGGRYDGEIRRIAYRSDGAMFAVLGEYKGAGRLELWSHGSSITLNPSPQLQALGPKALDVLFAPHCSSLWVSIKAAAGEKPVSEWGCR